MCFFILFKVLVVLLNLGLYLLIASIVVFLQCLHQIEDQQIFSQKIEMFNFCLQTTKYMPDDDDVQVFHAFMLKFDIRLLINRERTNDSKSRCRWFGPKNPSNKHRKAWEKKHIQAEAKLVVVLSTEELFGNVTRLYANGLVMPLSIFGSYDDQHDACFCIFMFSLLYKRTLGNSGSYSEY